MKRFLWISLTLLVLTSLGLRFLLRSEWLLDRIRTEAAAAIPGLRIDRIEGDLWSDLRVSGIVYSDSLSRYEIDSLKVSHSVWPLLFGRIEVRSLNATGLRVSVWTDTAAVEAGAPFDWPDLDARIDAIGLVNGSLTWNGVRHIEGLAFSGSARYADRTPNLRVDSLSFLPVGLPFEGASASWIGNASNRRIDLNRLIFATGHSVIRASGHVGIDSGTMQVTARANPLAWKDLMAVAAEQPLREDLNLRLDLNGSLHQFQASVSATTPGLRGLDVDLLGRVLPSASLTEIHVRGQGADLSRILNDATLPSFGSLTAWFEGMVPLERPDSMALRGLVQIRDIRVQGQAIRDMETTLHVRPDSVWGEGMVRIGREPIRFDLAADGWTTDARFRLTAETVGFDLRAIRGFSDLPSSLNATVRAEGANGRVDATLHVRESTLNRAAVSDFHATLGLADDILHIRDARIRSAILAGTLSARYDLGNATDADNRLDADIRLIDLQPLATFIGVDTLAVKGTFQARLNRGPTGSLRLSSTLRIDSARVDDAKTGAISGDAVIDLLAAAADSVEARYRFDGTFALPLAISHSGIVRWTPESTHLRGDRLDIRLDDRSYRLEHAFVARRSGGDLSIENMSLVGDSGVRIAMDAASVDGVISAKGRIRNADLRQVAILADWDGSMTGLADLDFSGTLADGTPTFRSALHLREVAVEDIRLDSLRLLAEMSDERITLAGSAFRQAESWLDFAASLPFRFEHPDITDDAFYAEPVSGHLRVNPTRLEDWSGWESLFGLRQLSGRFQAETILSGTAGEPGIDGRIDLLGGGLAGVPIDSVGFAWTYSPDRGGMAIDGEWRSLNQTALRMAGTLPFQVDMRGLTLQDVSDKPIRLDLTTRAFNLEAVNAFADPDLARRIVGLLNGDLRIQGTLSDPVVDGSMRMRGGAVYLPAQNITLRDIAMEARFTPGRIELTEFGARSNGTAEMSGWITLEGLLPTGMDLRLTGRNLRVSDTRNLQLFTSIDARLTGSPDSASATGSITLERGTIFLEEFGETTVEQVALEGEPPSLLDGTTLYRNLNVEMRIRTDQNVWVRNRSAPELQLELTGDLDLVKAPGGEPLVFGSMGTRQGHLTQLGKRFTLEKGEVVFSGNAANPALNVRTAYVLRPPNDITVWYSIGGTLDEPTFTYESSPEMELQDMVSYTLFNRPFNALMSWEQSMTSQGSLGSMAVDLLADRVGDLAAGALGLDVVQIDNSRSSGNSGMTVKAGKYVNDKLFIAILQEFGGTTDSQVIMEYALRQNLNVVLTGSDRRKSGIDIQWKYDY